ncbi:MAG: DUF1624 domain-containing protein [Aquabacterium sp.]|uniref:DUF1624 domain-containing protein n=1 Tax=Aquabacterium sp. TaxID=1872578 RepID=UPI0025C0040A|nr:heparan-alpha-glucosaminide N-acetyltransferase [Aquabacterium sp.]MBI5927652.1 DUF1624 domain-containing protein [Aquabacterium sp.]
MRSGKGHSPADSSSSASLESGISGGGFAPGASRYDRLDALRGFALVWMACFHFCFDLSNYRLLDANFYSDPLWTNQRTCILSLFLLCAGAGQAVATAQGQSWHRFWRRWAQIVGCAALVSLGSWFMFPNSFIYFGVLHGMAVMLLVARLTAPLRAWLWPLGLLAIALPQFVAEPFFDARLTNWVGLVTHKPITEDYVPVLPWLGVMWWGLAATQWILAHRPRLLSWAEVAHAGKPLDSGDNGGLASLMRKLRHGLALLGRWSLTFYMVHQPVLIGGLLAWMTLTGRPVP